MNPSFRALTTVRPTRGGPLGSIENIITYFFNKTKIRDLSSKEISDIRVQLRSVVSIYNIAYRNNSVKENKKEQAHRL
ncbi:hypothetical protein COZ78_01125 [bacterium (Candidatus Gribaldobacteria) CG_4_8_14_3_um_filter_42_11]|uniref:Uncharacterized protein n=1 Tax=bacterium (Candidatus Gribaldobacteria) CG_4_8_14_3_um_filter_42_11 TaxID=2014267 RepID=A0A2M7IYP3_9BACT|nr:MAG: hypothetical protein COZ78_01125 [bacterium (Candidatus Gribaldobacteria) CG_4_8_14_3_um_filter_42_11]